MADHESKEAHEDATANFIRRKRPKIVVSDSDKNDEDVVLWELEK